MVLADENAMDKTGATSLAIGWGFTGVYEAFADVIAQLEAVRATGHRIYPIMSCAAASTNTRYGPAATWLERLASAAGRKPLTESIAVEPLGRDRILDLMVVAPCSGATLARIANAISTDPVALAVKGHLRNRRPVLLGVATNDGLGLNARNLGLLLAAAHFYFVPFGQDNPTAKPTSLTAVWPMLPVSIDAALRGEQLQPLLLGLRGSSSGQDVGAQK